MPKYKRRVLDKDVMGIEKSAEAEPLNPDEVKWAMAKIRFILAHEVRTKENDEMFLVVDTKLKAQADCWEVTDA